jgi:glycosyltransferase involved in cell wall biosynthesis
MKQPLVSVIVPTKNSDAYLEPCLASIMSQTYKNLELIVVDNNSTDKTKEISKKYTRKVYNYGPERSAQRNVGVQKSTGQYVLITDSDMQLNPTVVSTAVETFQSNKKLKGLIVPEESFGEGFWAQCKRLERSFYVGVSWMEAARFFDRKTFDEFKGYDLENTGTEDYDLPQRIQEKYGSDSIGRIDVFIRHDEQKLNLRKTAKKKYYYAQRLERYSSIDANKSNFRKQSSPLARYALFFRNPRKLFRNPVYGVGMLYLKTAEYAAGSAGYVKSKLKSTKT